MENEKEIICHFLPLFINYANAQNKIFYDAYKVQYTTALNNIKKIKMPWGNLGGNVVSIYTDGSKILFRKKDIWGIEKNNLVLRFNEGYTLQLVDTNAIIIYKTYARRPVYYFSENLNSKAVLLTRKKIMKAFDIEKFPQVYKKSLVLRQVLFYTDDFRVSVGSSDN